MEVITHKSISSWGETIYLMDIKGRAFSKAYLFNKNKETFFLSDLSVLPESRKQGLGLKMQELREDIGREMGYKYSCLWVKKDSWMKEWYSRRGYEYHMEYTKGNIWMRKKLVNSKDE